MLASPPHAIRRTSYPKPPFFSSRPRQGLNRVARMGGAGAGRVARRRPWEPPQARWAAQCPPRTTGESPQPPNSSPFLFCFLLQPTRFSAPRPRAAPGPEAAAAQARVRFEAVSGGCAAPLRPDRARPILRPDARPIACAVPIRCR